MFLLRGFRLSFAILNLTLSAKYFGISLERDVWVLALSSIIIFDIAIWAPINDTFRAKFLFIKEEEGEEKALYKARALFLLTNVVTVCLVTLIILFPQSLAKLLAPGYGRHQLASLTLMIRVLAPSFLINQVTKLLTAVLNAYGSFIVPEISGIVTQAATFASVILLAPSIGIMSLAVSYYFGLILLTALLSAEIRKLNIALFKGMFSSKMREATGFLVFSAPFFFSHFAAQISNIIEKALASSLETGSIAVIDYARKFSDIPLEVLASTIATLLIPLLSVQFARGNRSAFSVEFKKIYQMGILILTVLVALLSSCPQSFVNILYGKSNIADTALIKFANMTMFYSWAMFSVFHYQIFGAALISTKNGKFYAIFGIIAQVLMSGLNLIFYKKIGIYIFPLSLAISHLIAAALMFSRSDFLASDVKRTVFKYPVVMIVICSGMFFINHTSITIMNDFLLIAVNLILIGVFLITSLMLFKMEEYNWIRHAYKTIMSKMNN
jgi:putative peptidoglycan lipid II flippase